MRLEHDVALAPRTTLGVGGRARFYCEATSENDLEGALDWARQRSLPLAVLGGGSNVVIADEGFDGLVVRVAMTGIRATKQGDRVRLLAMAGHSWDEFVSEQVAHGRQGVECLSGIPGLVGATPIQNVGAYGQEVAESIVSVRALDVETGRYREFSNADCKFAYRNSVFKRELPGRFVVTQVEFELAQGGAPTVRYGELSKAIEQAQSQQEQAITLAEVAKVVRKLRAKKSMLLVPGAENSRSCGSFFVNPVVPTDTLARIRAIVGSADVPNYPESGGRVKLPAAWLIERAGLERGYRQGPVGLSTRHTLALVCHEGATAREVVAFAGYVRAAVEARFGVRLIPEPSFWGFELLQDGLPKGVAADGGHR